MNMNDAGTEMTVEELPRIEALPEGSASDQARACESDAGYFTAELRECALPWQPVEVSERVGGLLTLMSLMILDGGVPELPVRLVAPRVAGDEDAVVLRITAARGSSLARRFGGVSGQGVNVEVSVTLRTLAQELARRERLDDATSLTFTSAFLHRLSGDQLPAFTRGWSVQPRPGGAELRLPLEG
jgi:hypothetical protein